MYSLLQVIDVLAASIEYGLEGLTKVPGVCILVLFPGRLPVARASHT